MSPGTIIHVKRGVKTRGRGALGWRHIADLQPVRPSSLPLTMMNTTRASACASSSSSSSHHHNQSQHPKEQQRIIILQSIRSIRATIMNLSSNNDYNDYFGAELDDLIGNLEEDNERLHFTDLDDDDDGAEMDFQLDKTDHPCDDDDDDSVQTSSIVTPPTREQEDRAPTTTPPCFRNDAVNNGAVNNFEPTPCLSRPRHDQEERQKSYRWGANAVDNFFAPSARHYHQQRDSESCSDLSMSTLQSSTVAAPSPVANVDVHQHQGTDSESFTFQQEEEHPYTEVQYDKALQNLAESMKRTEFSRRQIMMLKRTETTRRHVTMARVMLSHEQQRVLHLAKMKLNQQQQQQMPQQVQQGQPPQEQLQQQNPLQRQTLSSPMVASFFSNSSSATGGSSRSSFANTMDQGRKRISMYMGQVNHTL
eukprot:CAMPEP_0196134444 /NCGR_PEP_ID=MMETSP0910-20130528/3351_1 /TAXON_ID=49265 /ORGANISM="Thalassiosira rotula, Strain GSO102" /LENGTH=420 /DNA_ID=CAMNT_0041394373 /DNA_START=16 /DNA_END=1278 /DNA_ORIENTATION=-